MWYTSFYKKGDGVRQNRPELAEGLITPTIFKKKVVGVFYFMGQMGKVVALAAGTLVGGFARYYLAGFIYRVFGTQFPHGTLAVNLIGCFLIGFFSSLSEEKFLMGPEARLLWMVGFCGAFTTFSTFMLETTNLLKDGENLQALLNVFLSLVLGFLVFKIGVFLAEFI